MAEIIFNCQFVNTQFSNSSDSKIKTVDTNDMISYYERKEACDYTQENFKDDDIYEVDTEKALDYYNYRVGSTGGFNKNGDMKKNQAQDLFNKYKPKAMYRMVFSFEEDFLSENGFLTKKNIQKLITKSMDKNIRHMGLNPSNVEWGAYYHTNTAHPHVHIWLFEKNPTKEYYRLPRKTFKKMRSNVVRTMHISSEIYATRDQSKKELLKVLENLGLDGSMIYKAEKLDKKTFKHDKKFCKMLSDLEKVIPHKGSLKFNSANIYPYKKQITELVNYILAKKEIKDYYKAYKDLLEKERQLYNNRYYSDEEKMEKNRFVDNKEKELTDRIANMILQNIKNYRSDCKTYKTEKETVTKENNDQPYSEKNLAKYSLHTRSAVMDAGVLDELANAIDIGIKANNALERELDQMVKKAKQEISINSKTPGI